MADTQRSGLGERDIDQAITALKKGAYLLKYGRRGKPKFCPIQLSNDESMLTWYSGKEEKHLKLSQVSKIIPGQRTAIFQRYPRPEKEYQSFSLVYNDRSLDLICKDKDEAEVWFVGLKALITRGNHFNRWRIDSRSESSSSDTPNSLTRKNLPSVTPFDPEPRDGQGTGLTFERIPQKRLGKAFSDIISYTAAPKTPNQPESVPSPLTSLTPGSAENSNGRNSSADGVRVSLSSAVSSSSHGSGHEDFDALGDVFIWGEGVGDGVLGGGMHIIGSSSSHKANALLPKPLESTVVLDVHSIACGGRHAVLVTKQGEIFSWGEASGGRLGHGIEADIPQPKLMETLSGMNIEFVACGEFHTCAITCSGDLYTWGDGTHNSGLLGHGSEASHWFPKKVCGDIDGLRVSYVSCGPWHTAAVTSAGQLFTFGDGTFGALGHGDCSSASVPREVEALRGLRTRRVACGVWHTAAVVELMIDSSGDGGGSGSCSSGKLFTWGDGDKGRLGHGDKEPKFVPQCVTALVDENICQVACGHDLTVALTAAGRVYTMGSTSHGQLGNPKSDGKLPTLVESKIADRFVEEIGCGSYHVTVLTSKSEVYTWGNGARGQLGHGDTEDRKTPTLVGFLKDKQVKTVVCGSNFTAIICLHKWVSSADHSQCSACRNQFNFRRKRHNCYNCGLVFCNACSNKKSVRASLAPNMSKPYRVCDDCFNKLKKADSISVVRVPKGRMGNTQQKTNEVPDRESVGSRLQGQLSKLSSVEVNNLVESQHPRHDKKLELDNYIVSSPILNGNSWVGGKMTTFLDGAYKKVLPISAAVSGIPSQATSLVGITSPFQSSNIALNDSKHINGSVNEEILSLRAQVEDLTAKSNVLEAELERKSRQLAEVTAIAAAEAEKCKSAKEVIKSLTTQLREMAKKVPEGDSSSITKSISIIQNTTSSESQSTSTLSVDIETNGNSADHEMLLYGTKNQSEKPQWVVQAEPGVYITLSPLPGGSNELKRVRFSRKHFTEQEAEKWWAENGTRVCEKHNIQSSE